MGKIIRNGKYIIDSIESGLVKLLFSEDETLEEVLNIDHFSHPIKDGNVINIDFENGKLLSYFFEDETHKRREQAKSLLEKLKNKIK